MKSEALLSKLEDNLRKKAQVHELITVSHHEAGHAIYGLLHFMRISEVYLLESPIKDRINGITHFDSLLNSKGTETVTLTQECLNNEICMYFAGLAAEKHLFKITSGMDQFPRFLKNGCQEDIAEISKLIKKYDLAPPGKKRYAFKKKLFSETLNELQANWDGVTLVAHALFKNKRLNYQELKELLTKKSSNKDFWKSQFKTINYIFEYQDSLTEREIKSIISN